MASLNPLSSNLDLRKAKHLLRRATFNYSKEQIDTFVGMSATAAVNSLTTALPNTLSEPYDPRPFDNPDGYFVSNGNFEGGSRTRKNFIVAGWWFYNALQQTTLKHKLSFFLHSIFIVDKRITGDAEYIHDYLNLMDFYALGNIKDLAKKITLDNAMLGYLDNTLNNKFNPNENYSREFLELFTIVKGEQIGPGNYTNFTEIDVQQAAKVFTGFRLNRSRDIIDPDTGIPSGFISTSLHDPNDKTFSSAFGGQVIQGRDTEAGILEELHEFVDMVFNQEETAKAYCRRLYRYFVKSQWTEEVENDIITPMAQILRDNDYDILPVVTTLLSSEHFFDADDSDATDNIIGSIMKSPLQMIGEVLSVFEIDYPDAVPEAGESAQYYFDFFLFVHRSYLNTAGLGLFAPDSVAGYPAYYLEPAFDRNWFLSNTIISRFKLIESLIEGKDTVDRGNINTQLDIVAFVRNKTDNPSDPNLLITEISDLLYPERIDTDRINYFKSFLVDEGFEDFYWTNAWDAYLNDNDDSVVKTRLNALITVMVNAAEFQLM